MNEQQTASRFTKHFEYKTREQALYSRWEAAQIFQPEVAAQKDGPVFNIAMPPPNANGELHLGHSFGYTVMDILGRYHRLCGERVLLLPGKDHAGIQTQVVFEKKLQNEKVDIRNVSRAALFEQCYQFCVDRAQYMRAQEKRLALSADWSRELFTLDPKLTDIIYETFEQMWRDQLIYRGRRIINWSVFSQTALSDVEVEYKEQEGGLWYLCYPLKGGPRASGHRIKLPSGREAELGAPGLYSATTRPETMLGDSGLAVNPDDPRYKEFIGAEVLVPLVGRTIRVVGDTRVDPTYGTGVVKVTPAHDFTDSEIGADHKLESIQVIGKDGRITPAGGERFVGLTVKDARKAVLEALASEGLLLDETKITHKVPIGERGKDIIEPLISEQWFVRVDAPGNSLRERALTLVRDGRIAIYPARFQVLVEQWLENLKDWCISRQIWWGHRLPVWYRDGTQQQEVHVGRTPPSPTGWTQDSDTFDTWFSSGQWAYSTMAACNLLDLKQPKNSQFFPTHTMVMGRDILFFWACRMLLLTTYRLGTVPWRNIFFTGLIRDENGQKMSKSKGNGIEPNAMIEKYGTDALRLSLVMGAAPGNDIIVSERKIDGYSKFVNKLWNAAKLLELKLGDLSELRGAECPIPKSLADQWILFGLARVAATVNQRFSKYEISIAADELYNFTWSMFCDWYLEMMKVLIDASGLPTIAETRAVAAFVFERILTMLHPFIPYVTEEIYQNLGFGDENHHLATNAWNRPIPAVTEPPEMQKIIDTVNAIRSVKSALNISHKRIRVSPSESFSTEGVLLVQEVARVDFASHDEFSSGKALRKPYVGGFVTCEVDGKESYRKRLEKDLEGNKKVVADLEQKLGGAFAAQAKPDLVEKERERLLQSQSAVAQLSSELALLE